MGAPLRPEVEPTTVEVEVGQRIEQMLGDRLGPGAPTLPERFAQAGCPRCAEVGMHLARRQSAPECGLDGRIPRALGEDSSAQRGRAAPGAIRTRHDALDDPACRLPKYTPTSTPVHLGDG